MKKYLALFMVVMVVMVVMVGLSGCSSTEKQAGKSKKIKIIATIFPPYDFARQVGKDNVDLKMLISPGANSHGYRPTPQDVIAIKQADLFIYVGGDDDVWVKDTLKSIEGKGPKTIRMMDLVSLLKDEEHDHEHDHNHDDKDHKHEEHKDKDHKHEGKAEHHHGEYDQHVWTSPLNVIKIVGKITGELQAFDPEHKAVYQGNSDRYIEQLKKLDGEFRSVVNAGNRKTIVFGDPFPFRYFANAYGLSYLSAFPNCAGEAEPSAATVAHLIDEVKEEKIPVVFQIELSSGKIAQRICEATGAKQLTLYSAHNLTKDEFQKGMTYLDFMNKNLANLREALK